MNYIKVGDVVYLKEYYKHEQEGVDWSFKEGLPLNTPLKVTRVSDNGWIEFKGIGYWHHPDKFIKQNIEYEIY